MKTLLRFSVSSILLLALVNSILAQTTWVTRAPMPTPRSNTGFCVLSNKLFVLGGAYQLYEFYSDKNEAYDPITDAWTTGAPLPQPLLQCRAVGVDGTILVMGGVVQGPPWYDVSDVNAYDPATDTWSPKSSMLLALRAFAIEQVNGLVYVIGGHTQGGISYNDVQVYNPQQDSWTFGPPMPTARSVGASAVIGNKIYVFGGLYYLPGGGYNVSDVVEVFDATTQTWETRAPMPTARLSHVATVLKGRIYVTAGNCGSPGIDIYDPATDTWSPGEAPPATGATSEPAMGTVSSTGGTPDTIIIAGGDHVPCSGGGYIVSDTIAFSLPNNPPVAQCKSLTMSAGANCTANASIDNASYDPDAGDTITITQAPAGPYSVGTTTVTLTVTDSHGASSSCTASVTVVYQFSGFLAPIGGGADATGGSFANPLRTFKLGSTIPVKFTASCGGSAVLAGVHRLQAVKYSGSTSAGTPIDATPQDAATVGNQFRLTTDGQWQFNLDTEGTGMSVGIWLLRATLSDGSEHGAWIQIK